MRKQDSLLQEVALYWRLSCTYKSLKYKVRTERQVTVTLSTPEKVEGEHFQLSGHQADACSSPGVV